MARPSLKDKRRQEILTAFARCVALYGLEGATLEKIAAEADVARPAVRHFVGNRDELVEALTAFVKKDYSTKLDGFFAMLPQKGRIEAAIELLFNPAHFSSSDDIALAQALTAASRQYPSAGQMLAEWIADFDLRLSEELRTEFPAAEENALRAVSFGIISIYFNIDALSALDLPDHMTVAAKEAAVRLVETLKG